MANGHGGKRTPSNPAPVSGPGQLSRRTDSGPAAQYVSGLPYGEGQDFMDLQTAAPMGAGNPSTPTTSAGPSGPSGAAPVPLNAPTQFPDEPLTAGSAAGPGPGPDALPSSVKPTDRDIIVKYLPAMQRATTFEGAPDSFKAFVRWLQGQR